MAGRGKAPVYVGEPDGSFRAYIYHARGGGATIQEALACDEEGYTDLLPEDIFTLLKTYNVMLSSPSNGEHYIAVWLDDKPYQFEQR
jgi:hypothetical protein